jgi:hypothetical protein
LREFQNRVLRRISACKREKETGGWRIFGPVREEVKGGQEELHNEELHH